MKLKTINNRGGIDIQSWLTGTLGFFTTYIVYIVYGPAMKLFAQSAVDMNLPTQAQNLIPFIQWCYDWSMVMSAGIFLVFIVYSSIRREVEQRITTGRFG